MIIQPGEVSIMAAMNRRARISAETRTIMNLLSDPVSAFVPFF